MVFAFYGTGQATINGGSGAGFLAQNMGGITVQNLIFTGTSTLTNTAHGIQFDNNQAGNTTISGISVINCTVSGFGLNGILVSGSLGTSGFSNVLIDSCTVHDCTGNYTGAGGSSGILVYSLPGYGQLSVGRASHSNVIINNCLSYNNAGKAGATNWVGSGIAIGEIATGTIQYCTAHHNGANSNNAAGSQVWILTFDSTNVTIQFCESHHNSSSNLDGDGFDLDGGCQNCTTQYCYAHDNFGSGFNVFTYNDATLLQDTNKVVRFCISQNDSTGFGGGISLGSTSTRAQSVNIHNNTIYSNGCLAIGGSQISIGTGHIANNIFYSTNNAPIMANFVADGNPSSMVVVGNDYRNTGTFSIRWNSTTYTTFATWQTATGQEKVGGVNVALTVDPQLAAPDNGGTINGYNPSLLPGYVALPGSPVLGGGQNLNVLYGINVGGTDFFGSPALLDGSNIGAASI